MLTPLPANWALPLLATLIATLGAAAGIWLPRSGPVSRMFIPFSGGILIGVAALGLAPEIAQETGWLLCLGLMLSGFLALLALERAGYVVCPSCSHSHDHAGCHEQLHGFATPVVTATALHAFLDGWGLGIAAASGIAELRYAVALAILLHKIPEGLALGAILRAATPSRRRAFGLAVLAELATLAGAALVAALGPGLGLAWTSYPLAFTGGFFLFLGWHAIHGDYRRRGVTAAAIAALGGAAAAAALQAGARSFFPF